MGSFGIPKSLPPYVYYSPSGGGGDCSEMICTKNCLRWCINLFPPPPSDDDSGPNFSPLIIVIITVLASALFFVTFYTVCTSCSRRRRRRRRLRDVEAADRRETPAANDAAEVVKKESRVFKYKKVGGGGGGGGVEVQDTECPVCLSEFEEEESLRLLPKCSHVFHLVCIDTWVKSQPSCPICRASVVLFDTSSPAPVPAPASPVREPISQENSR